MLCMAFEVKDALASALYARCLHASAMQQWHAGEHIENTLEALTALIQRDNSTPEGLSSLAYIEFDVHVSVP